MKFIVWIMEQFTWRHRAARMQLRISNLEAQLKNQENIARIYESIDKYNTREMAKQDRLIRTLRFRLSEIGRPERQRKIKLP